MNRLTFHENSRWGLKGVEDKEITNNIIYLALHKLMEYEDLKLNPDDVVRLMDKLEDLEENLQTIENEMNQLSEKADTVHIGTEIHGYVIKGISENHCIAERINKVKCDDFVVWSIDNDRKGVSIGRYFNDFAEALSKFSELMMADRIS